MAVEKELIANLQKSTQQETKAGRANASKQAVLDHPDLVLTRWKFSEFDYYSDKLICSARGLFTYEDRIVLRGYDKFFNCGETPRSKWENLEKDTTGPYFVTVKENGCLLLVAGLNGVLLVTSKNSTGTKLDAEFKSHAQEGKRRLLAQLEQLGKTEKDLADELESLDVTAVGEFCDDEFEEHVLKYTPEEAGIYLHGLNRNTATFATLEPSKVNELSAKFGFQKVDYLVFDTIEKTKKFLDECAETGSWNDRDIEGFVIRCKRKDTNADYLFKYKFEEPYLLFRAWREALRTYIAGNQPKGKKHAKSSARFVAFARNYFQKDPELFQKIKNTKRGVIELRDKYIETQNLDSAALLKLSLDSNDDDLGDLDLPVRYCFVPIAVVGCGKTTLGAALTNLVGLPHVQNDNIPSGKSKKKQFIDQISKALLTAPETAPGVYIDRNNARRDERKQIIDAVREQADITGLRTVFICLDFMPNGVVKKQKELCRERAAQRGENHATLGNLDKNKLFGVINQFERSFRPFDKGMAPDSEFDMHVEIDITKPMKQILIDVVNAVQSKYSDLKWADFTDQQLTQATEAGLSYRAPASKPAPPRVDRLKPAYFGLKIPNDVLKIVESAFGDSPPELWKKLQSKEYAPKTEFHITVAHIASHAKAHQALRSKYVKSLVLETGKSKSALEMPVSATVKLVSLGYNDRLIAVKVEIEGVPCANKVPHITIGFAPGVFAKEAGESFEKKQLTEIPISGQFNSVPLFAYP